MAKRTLRSTASTIQAQVQVQKPARSIPKKGSVVAPRVSGTLPSGGVRVSIVIGGEEVGVECRVYAHKKYQTRIKLVVAPKAVRVATPFVGHEDERRYASLEELQSTFPTAQIELLLGDEAPMVAALFEDEVSLVGQGKKLVKVMRVFQVEKPELQSLQRKMNRKPVHVSEDISQLAAMLAMQEFCQKKKIVYYFGSQTSAA